MTTDNKIVELEKELAESRKREADLKEQIRFLKKKIKHDEESFQVQKMESIGLLAGGIAHDFNNILAAVMGYVEMSRNTATDGSSIRRWLTQALSACEKAKELVLQILTFSRQHEQKLIAINPGMIVPEVIRSLEESTPAAVSFDMAVDYQSGLIMGDPEQFQQVIMNICTNAVEAMHDNKGVINVSLDKISSDNAELQSLTSEKKSDFVKLSIIDSGKGMEKKVLDRMFEPFFTTKKMGEGAGMGLAVVHGMIRSFNGEVHVESDVGKGTRVRIYFPVISDYKEQSPIIPGGTENILLVDDEPDLLEMLHELVESLGYQVTSFSDSIKAGDAFCENPAGFDLVITDQTMPKMTGADLARKILSIKKEMPIVLCTGYNDSIAPEIAEEIGITDFLKKPIKRNKLAEIIRHNLEG